MVWQERAALDCGVLLLVSPGLFPREVMDDKKGEALAMF